MHRKVLFILAFICVVTSSRKQGSTFSTVHGAKMYVYFTFRNDVSCLEFFELIPWCWTSSLPSAAMERKDKVERESWV